MNISSLIHLFIASRAHTNAFALQKISFGTLKLNASVTTAVPDVVAPFKWNWIVEVASIGFLILFLINYIVGRKANEKIASTFARTYRDLFASEFTIVGVNGAVLVKESQHTFRLNGTGRSFVKGIQANLRLQRRHDLVGLLYSRFWSPARDLVDIQVAMNDDALDSIVFALTKNRDAREVAKDFADLALYTKSVKIPQDGPKSDATLDGDVWTALAESKEITTLVLDSATRATLNKFKDSVRLVHVTDQYSGHKEYKKVLHIVFYLPPVERMEELRTLMKMTFHLIDHVAKLQLPVAVKQTIEKARAKVVSEEKKEELEAAKEKREQEKLEKRREKMKNMDANERADFEEKERQRKMNKRMKKMSVKA